LRTIQRPGVSLDGLSKGGKWRAKDTMREGDVPDRN